MILQETFTLSNGVEIPKIGLGTWEISDVDVVQAVKDATEIGYRHIDTAQGYGNERGVGEGVRACGVKRDEIFVTTKLDAAVKSYQAAVASIDSSLQALGLDYIDLLLIHSPKPWTEFHNDDPYFEGNRETWRALEEAYQAGKLRAIGVSNFQAADLDNILASCTIKPMVNQILAHISNTPHELIRYTQEKGILVEAYSPIAHGELLKNQAVTKMAEQYGVSVPQLGICYVLQLGLLPLPKTANPAHMKTNAEVDFVIAEEDMAVLKNIEPIKDYGEFSIFPVFGGKLD
ncbi:MAG: aldo/keto reductase [Caldilineaceae bacterium]|nr:aldo/keto reductase [Caldilineaceae bacterium]